MTTTRLVGCWNCGVERWTGYGPCSACGAESPEHRAETERINRARAEAGLPPLSVTPPSHTGEAS